MSVPPGEAMKTMVKCGLAVVVLGTVALPGPGDAIPKAGTEPRGVPLDATLTAREATYALDLGGVKPETFRRQIAEGDSTGVYPLTPRVDLQLEIRNTSRKEIQVRFRGTRQIILLYLEGPGAVSVTYKRRTTDRTFSPGEAITIGPGKSQTLRITTLTYGVRDGQGAYWTEPGDYTLTASFRTEVAPAPPGSKDAGNGFGIVTVTSPPLPIKVTGKRR